MFQEVGQTVLASSPTSAPVVYLLATEEFQTRDDHHLDRLRPDPANQAYGIAPILIRDLDVLAM